MKKSIALLFIAVLAFSSPLAFAADTGTSTNTNSINRKADIDPRNAGGSTTTGTPNRGNEVAAGTTDTTTTSQSMSDRRDYMADRGPSALTIFSIIVALAIAAGFAFRAYRARHANYPSRSL